MNIGPATTAPASSGIRLSNLALWAFQALLAAFFAFAGINKLLGLQQEMIDNFARMGPGVWFRYLVGVLELIGAGTLVIPRVSTLGALWLACIMVGAVITHIFVQPPMYLAIGPAIGVVILGLIARARWPERGPLVRRYLA